MMHALSVRGAEQVLFPGKNFKCFENCSFYDTPGGAVLFKRENNLIFTLSVHESPIITISLYLPIQIDLMRLPNNSPEKDVINDRLWDNFYCSTRTYRDSNFQHNIPQHSR